MPDDHGVELGDISAARAEAIRVISELLESATWTRDRHSANYIDVADENGQLVDTVAVWEVILRGSRA